MPDIHFAVYLPYISSSQLIYFESNHLVLVKKTRSLPPQCSAKSFSKPQCCLPQFYISVSSASPAAQFVKLQKIDDDIHVRDLWSAHLPIPLHLDAAGVYADGWP